MLETENYFLEAHVFDHDRLFVTFESAEPPGQRPKKFRSGWGAEALRKHRVSCLCVKPKFADWYARPDLPEALARLEEFFARFRRVITYGGSMGGFGALAFADLVGAHDVIALNPQSTLDRRKVPWENRFEPALPFDFTGPYGDAKGKFDRAERVFVLVDRWFSPDWKHIERIMRDNIIVLNTPFLRHRTTEHLRNMQVLGPIVDAFIQDRFSEPEFHRHMRARRRLNRYFDTLGKMAADRQALRSIVDRCRQRSELIGNP
ncbi:hypothetical protein [Thalassovita aquimarina]|uniref:Alpha/beta hydrolase family protein n=1 Tax=Thalassovita aquimarina TaxID=2785917 RepID=A0ABS5HM97_9RHOB|nr:hypothetical protein [Thalassovita aquimarina]MBR9650101.1 hypothetical protein [Thalassovita aquimarina]